MCTAISYKQHNHYFGRNLDVESSYNEKVIITPRSYTYDFKHTQSLTNHYSIIGTGIIKNGMPLYFDGINEVGLGVAALNFPDIAKYNTPLSDFMNIASFEFIPWVLCQCKNIYDVKNILSNVNIVNTPFSEELSPTPLHWMVADKESSITVESTEDGLKVYDNPVGVLTNNPPFNVQIHNLNRYMGLSPYEAHNTFSPSLNLKSYSRGMGALGLPGALSSESRFVKACFVKENSVCDSSEEGTISQFFHILGSVEQVKGCVRLENSEEYTAYSSCFNTDKGIYYYKTYENSQITAIDMHKEDLDGCEIMSYPLIKSQQIKYVNEKSDG